MLMAGGQQHVLFLSGLTRDFVRSIPREHGVFLPKDWLTSLPLQTNNSKCHCRCLRGVSPSLRKEEMDYRLVYIFIYVNVQIIVRRKCTLKNRLLFCSRSLTEEPA